MIETPSSNKSSDKEPTLTPRQRIAVVIGILPAGMITGMDTFAVGVALPRMQGVLSATLLEISWILTAFLVAATVFTPMYGWLARRVGRRKLFLIIIVGFCSCAGLIAQSDSLEEIIFFRFCQGFFGAGFNPLLMQIVLATFPVSQQGIAFGWLTTGRMSGIIVGPLLGGIMTEYFSWRFVFLSNIPLGMIAAYLVYLYVPRGHPENIKKFDTFGFLILGVSILALQYALDQGQTLGWFDSIEIVAATLLSAGALYLFIGHIFLSRNPFLNPRVFANREFLIGLLFRVSSKFYGFRLCWFNSSNITEPHGLSRYFNWFAHGTTWNRHDGLISCCRGNATTILCKANFGARHMLHWWVNVLVVFFYPRRQWGLYLRSIIYARRRFWLPIRFSNNCSIPIYDTVSTC